MTDLIKAEHEILISATQLGLVFQPRPRWDVHIVASFLVWPRVDRKA